MRFPRWKLNIHALLQLADFTTTYIIFHVPHSTARELNPLAKFLIKKNRWDVFLLMKILVIGYTELQARIIYNKFDEQEERKFNRSLIFYNILMTTVVANNIRQLQKHFKKQRALS